MRYGKLYGVINKSYFLEKQKAHIIYIDINRLSNSVTKSLIAVNIYSWHFNAENPILEIIMIEKQANLRQTFRSL